ncbi:MAG: hypothetical protein KGH63_03970, partial [Candidatus Micrarchaeota archaeon]|nr:hypothetical protein [Candidatus Micrarchaeota archaeon]
MLLFQSSAFKSAPVADHETAKEWAGALVEAALRKDYGLDHQQKLGGYSTVYDFLKTRDDAARKAGTLEGPGTIETMRTQIVALLIGEDSLPFSQKKNQSDLLVKIVDQINKNLSLTGVSDTLHFETAGAGEQTIYTLVLKPGLTVADVAKELEAWKNHGASNVGEPEAPAPNAFTPASAATGVSGEFNAASERNIKAQELFMQFLQQKYQAIIGLSGQAPSNLQTLFYQWMGGQGIDVDTANGYQDELTRPVPQREAPGVARFLPRELSEGMAPALMTRLFAGYRSLMTNGTQTLGDIAPEMDGALSNWKKYSQGVPPDLNLAKMAETAVRDKLNAQLDVVGLLLVAARLSPTLDERMRRQVYSSDVNESLPVLVQTLELGREELAAQIGRKAAPVLSVTPLETWDIRSSSVSPSSPMMHGQSVQRPYAPDYHPTVEELQDAVAGTAKNPGLLNNGIKTTMLEVSFSDKDANDMSSFSPARGKSGGGSYTKATMENNPAFMAVVNSHKANHPGDAQAAADILAFC